ncbi:hypothetical protein G9A89_014045 [Geosiphon pyriformis]|nr:hypothetical protein G9A89_014045 [Geosiphon pyriformis]
MAIGRTQETNQKFFNILSRYGQSLMITFGPGMAFMELKLIVQNATGVSAKEISLWFANQNLNRLHEQLESSWNIRIDVMELIIQLFRIVPAIDFPLTIDLLNGNEIRTEVILTVPEQKLDANLPSNLVGLHSGFLKLDQIRIGCDCRLGNQSISIEAVNPYEQPSTICLPTNSHSPSGSILEDKQPKPPIDILPPWYRFKDWLKSLLKRRKNDGCVIIDSSICVNWAVSNDPKVSIENTINQPFKSNYEWSSF